MRDDDLTLIGEHYGLGRMASRPFGIDRLARRQGLHLIGQSGTGKSSLMLDMLRQDIAAGEGVTLIDPHGHLARIIHEGRWSSRRAGFLAVVAIAAAPGTPRARE
jgi:hypothetical protein